MSKSVNVIHLHVLNLVCLILIAFPLLPQHFWKVSGYVGSYILLCNSNPKVAKKKHMGSGSFWNGPGVPFSYRAICSANNKSAHFKRNFPNKYILYITYTKDSLGS